MSLKSLTYTSLAALDLQPADLEAIHRTARDTNALEGVTGILIYNGIHFLQVIEGAPKTWSSGCAATRDTASSRSATNMPPSSALSPIGRWNWCG
jgi:hypothetical protein